MLATQRGYEARMAQVLAIPPLAELNTMAFADLFLEDIRAYREERLSTAWRGADLNRRGAGADAAAA
jgi:hypothetical protein